MIPQIQDFLAEADELDVLLRGLSDRDWARATQFKDWTINDVVLHLYASDLLSLASTDGEAAFKALRESIVASRRGRSMIDETRERHAGLSGDTLRQRWIDGVRELSRRLDALDPEARLPWVAMPMGVRMFVTARQMEVWAHGQAIYDLLGRTRVDTDRLKNIATIGVKTFGFSFSNHQLPVPAELPYVELLAPSGATWTYNDPHASSSVRGTAVDFCRVVTQTRNVADTRLVVEGDIAREWMAIAQCFAGPPQDPVAGSRFTVKTTATEASRQG